MKPFKVGTKRYIYDDKAPNNEGVCLAHILAFVPHPDTPKDYIVVYRFWDKYRHRYVYGAKPRNLLGIWDDYIKKVLSDRRQKR